MLKLSDEIVEFLKIIDSKLPIGLIIYDSNGYLYANKAFKEILGYSDEELYRRKVWWDILDPIKRNKVKNIIGNRERGGFIHWNWEGLEAIAKNGDIKYLNATSFTIKDPGIIASSSRGVEVLAGRFGGLGFVMDVTSEEHWKDKITNLSSMYSALSGINQNIIKSKSEEELFERLCKSLVQTGVFKLVGVVLDDRDGITIPYGYPSDDYLNYLKDHLNSPAEKKGPIFTAMKYSKISINNDTDRFPSVRPWKNEQLQKGFNSSASIPLVKKGKNIGVVTVYSEKNNFFDRDSFNLLKEIQGDLSFALNKLEDDKFSEIIKNFINTGHFMFAIMDNNFTLVYVNNAMLENAGFSSEEVLGKPCFLFNEALKDYDSLKMLTETISDGQPFREIIAWTGKDGEPRLWDTGITYCSAGENTGNYFIITPNDVTENT